MSVSRDRVHAIAALARLRLSDAEAELFAGQLSEILEHVAELGDIAETADEPGHDGAAPLRPDEPATDALRAPPRQFAPGWADGFFTVPRLEAMDDDADTGAP